MKVNWALWSNINALTESTLCAGEEKCLQPEEVEQINNAIAEASAALLVASSLMRSASYQFEDRLMGEIDGNRS